VAEKPAEEHRARIVITSRCERCNAALVILCCRKLEKERTYAFPCPGCRRQLERRLPCEFMEVRTAEAS
jgi:hypothetical protein